jgi:hypothetical protein
MDRGRMWERRGGYKRVEVRRGEVRKWTDVPLHRWIGPMVIVRQTTHRAYILAELDGVVSKLRFAAFRVIPYHARRRMNIDLETFFVFPDADEEMEDVEDETETDEEIQETAGLEGKVPSDDEEDN